MVNLLKKSLEYTCIFGGGAIRGISYVGAVRAMEELGVECSTIAGSSVGAIFAGLLSVGYSAIELKDIFMQVNYELFKDIHFGFGKDFALSKGEIFQDWLRDLIEKKFYGESYVKGENKPVTFADLDKKLVVITTDLTNFKYKEFSKAQTPDVEIAYAIRISSTMPGLMKPVEEDGAMLVDGDLQKSWPLWRLSPTLCPSNERILEFRLEGDFEGKGNNAINFMNTVYSCVTSLATDFIIDTYGNRDKFDYIKINTGTVVVVDFAIQKNKRDELMNIGYNLTMNYFLEDLPIKKKKLLEYYRPVYKHLDKINKLVSNNKIKLASEQLGRLYMDFCNSRKYIDLDFYAMVDVFKTEFLKNIQSPGLFGIHHLANYNTLKSKINSITHKYNERIMELESYVFRL